MHYGGLFSWNGIVEEFSVGNYEILIASPRCDLSWVNYNPASGNVLPDGAVIGGYQNGRQLYVARTSDTHSGHFYRYAAGYYDIIGMEGVVTNGPKSFDVHRNGDSCGPSSALIVYDIVVDIYVINNNIFGSVLNLFRSWLCHHK